MKVLFFLIVFGLGLIGLSGCYTIPRHFADDEEVVYYPPIDPYVPEPIVIIIDYPPPSPTIYYPPAPRPDQDQPRDRQPEKPKDSYNSRDRLQGGSDRGSGEINTDPPVRTPEQKDRGHQ